MFALLRREILQIVRRPIYWFGFFFMPVFFILFFTSLMSSGLPEKVPAAIVDRDGTSLSREITQNLGGMQSVDLKMTLNSFTEGRERMQRGEIFGFFLIPENFEADLMAGRKPEITFYTNMTYYVPASLLFKTFKATALYAKAGVAVSVLENVGASESEIAPMLQPVNIVTHGIHNPWLNYAYYLCNSFVPGVLQLMIFLLTCFSLGEEIKRGTSSQLLSLSRGSIVRALFSKIFPQTVIWILIVLMMEGYLFGILDYPMHGSLFWFTVNEIMFVLACQGWAVFMFGLLPNLRLSLSVSSLIGILSFSIGCFSFPYESMYGAIGIFSWIVPVRYNFLIYIDQALNGIDLYYSRIWYIAYIIFMVLPFPLLMRIKKAMAKPVYVP